MNYLSLGDDELNVPEGQGALIFKECGTDNPKSKKFSRKCRFDDEKDCVVCGRGYILRTKSKKQVRKKKTFTTKIVV